MTLTGTRFGDIDFEVEDVVTFSDGLVGFPDTQRFVLVCVKPESPFRWLQSLDEPDLAFLVADPIHFVPDYQLVVAEAEVAGLGLGDDSPPLVFVTANVPRGRPEEMTLNLAGPLVVNAVSRQARQVVVEDEAYTVRHRVFQQEDRVPERVAA
jgi:flagellar assembly factor FliW